MRRAAAATSASVAAHAIGFVLLARATVAPPHAPEVAVTILDTRAAPVADAPAIVAAPPLPTPAHPRAIAAARRGRVARLAPSPSAAAEPQPIAADADASADDASADDRAGDDHDEGNVAGDAPGGNGSSADAPPAPKPSRARPPGLDRATCIDHVDYPWRARLLDKEGVVRLRVVVGADGRVQQATVLQRAGYGFDETAADAVRTRCRFTPALDDDGRPTPFVIESYHFYFKLEDFDPRGPSSPARWGH